MEGCILVEEPLWDERNKSRAVRYITRHEPIVLKSGLTGNLIEKLEFLFWTEGLRVVV